MKKDLELLVEKEFFKSEKILGQKLLNEIILDSFFNGFSDKKLQEKANKPKKTGAQRAISFSSIPDIAVSELGWSKLATNDESVPPPEQRLQLENYLKNIKGNTLEEKVKSVNEFYTFKTIEELEASGLLEADSNSSKIQKVISYLVFLKTLTTIITNFNASAAGFAFEAFLGVLLGGSQIATGGGTIADLKTGDGTPISLKLYAENSVEVGGSYVDLVNDMSSKDFIRYVIAMKALEGKGLDLSGKISIYQFDLNKDNILRILGNTSKHSKECILLPQDYISGPNRGKADYSELKKIEVSDEQINNFFNEKLAETFGKNRKLEKKIKAILSGADIDRQGSGNLFNKSGGAKLGYSEVSKKFIKDLVKNNFVTDGTIQEKEVESVIVKLLKIFQDTNNFVTKSSSTEEIEKRFAQINWATPEESVKYYDGLKKPDDKIKALKNTLGYLRTRQFSMSKAHVFNITGGADAKLAEIVVGRRNIETIINQMAGVLDEAIFEIFDSLSSLTTNLNTFFATGLEDMAAASVAQVSAKNIDKKTEKIKKNVTGA